MLMVNNVVNVIPIIAYLASSMTFEMDHKREVTCTSETLAIGCPERHVILVKRALYGRMEPGRCITSEYSHAIGCYADVTGHLQDLCSGQNRCSLMVASIDAIAQPCGKDFKSYLDIEHRCASASFIDDCHNSNHTVLPNPRGFLVLRPNKPLHTLQTTAKDFSTCPWVLTTDFGKRFNVSWRVPSNAVLLTDSLDLVPLPDDHNMIHGDFQSPPMSSSSQLTSPFCGVSWKFVEGGEETPYAACMSGVRKPQSRSYESKSNRLEIHFTGVLHNSHLFDAHDQQRLPLLEYSTIGCSQYKPPEGAFVSGQDHNMAVVCNISGQMWHITCQDGAWFGNVGSCGHNAGHDFTSVVSKPSAMPRLEMKLDRAGVITAVVVGVLLGGTFGAMMLLAIFILKRRERSKRRCKRKTPTTASTNFNETIYNTPPLRHNQTNLQQLHVSSDVISGCRRPRCADPDCQSQCLHPPSYHVLTTSPVSCTCRSSHNSPSGCCYSDQTQLISLPTPEDQSYFPANSLRGVTDLPDNVVISVEAEFGKDDNDNAKCSGPILRYPHSDYLAVKCDDIDD